MFARLAEDADDLCICTYPPESGEMAIEPILPNPIVVYARSDHPLVGVMGIPFSRFAEEPLLVRDPGSGTRAVAERLFAERRLAPKVRMELSSNEAIKEAILSGLGVAILTRYALGVEVSRDELAILDVESFPVERYWHLVYPTGKRLAPPAQAFVEMVKAEAKHLLAAKRAPLLPARQTHRARVGKAP